MKTTKNELLLAALCLAAPAAGSAQTETATDRQVQNVERGGLEEVVVTAQRRAEQTIEIPMSITAKSGEALAALGVDSALDLSFAVPSMSVFEIGAGHQIISIRGVGSQRGTSSLTGVYLDEIPISGLQQGDVQALDLRAIDLERVEVLKGPQGTLFGEGAAGGVVRFITKDPNLNSFEGVISTEVFDTADSADSSQEFTAIVNVPVVEDKFGIRVAAKYEDKAGWIDQPTANRHDINDSEVKHVRVKALLAATQNFRIKGAVEVHRNDGGASNIVNQGNRGRSNFRQAFDPSAPTRYSDDYDLANVTMTYDFGSAELLSSTSRAEFEGFFSKTQVLDAAPSPFLEILIAEAQHEGKTTSQELRLASTAARPFNWTIGASFKDAELYTTVGDAGIDAVVGAFDYARLEGLNAGQGRTYKSESKAGFVDGSYQLAQRFTLGAGLRYFVEDAESLFSTALDPRAASSSGDSDRLTYRAYAKFAATDHINLYASVGTGFRSGGFNDEGFVLRGAPPTYDQEKTLFYEAGAKMLLLDGRLRFDTAVFFGEYDGLQEDALINSPVDGGPLQFTGNGQDAEIRGVEWDVNWGVTNRLTLSLSGDVTDTEVIDIEEISAPLSPFFVGDPVNFVPKYSVSLRSDYEFDWFDAMPGFIRVNYDRKGKSYHSDRANVLLAPDQRQAVAPEVDFLNASIGGTWNSWDWSVFGRNLLDEEGALTAGATGFSAQARPRTVGITMSKAF